MTIPGPCPARIPASLHAWRALCLIKAALTLFTLTALWNANDTQARPRSLQELAAINGKLIETGVKYGSILPVPPAL